MAEKEVSFDDKFVAWYARYHKPVIVFVRKMVRCSDTAEELANDTFAKIYERKINLELSGNSVSNYIFTVAKNAAIDFINRRNVEQDKYQLAVLEEVIMNHDFFKSLEDAYIEEEILDEIERTLSMFSEVEQKVFIKRFYLNQTYRAVKASQGLSIYRLKKIESMILAKLRSNLSAFYDTRNVPDEARRYPCGLLRRKG